MQRESISTQTFVKGIAAVAVAAASLGTLRYVDYSTARTGGNYQFTPGQYSAAARGMESDVKVTITVDDHSITDVAVDVSGETAGIGAEIGDEVTTQILAAQSSTIDGVAGASISSQAVRDALDIAIEKAKNGDTSAETEAAESENIESEAAVSEAAVSENAGGSSSGYVPGTYTATAQGMESPVTVTVTVSDTAIEAVGIDVSGETPDVGASAGPELSKAILAAQSADIDGVSNATVTSDAVKAAAADALAQASGAKVPAADASAAEDEAVTEAAGSAEAAPAAAVSSPEAGNASYIPGTYTATVQGMESPVTVSITVSDTAIEAVGIDVSGESPDTGALTGPELSKAILAAQSADIDGVAGATVTSDAVKQAVEECITQAKA